MTQNKAVPVTIITGFLGAGKTTLLSEILKQHSDLKFLIIENEAGDINIDGQLIDKKENKLIELSNGCICCTLSTELGTVLNSVILSQTSYDYLLIEATGMAEPGQIIEMFSGLRIQRFFQLDAVVCIVDANNLLDRVDTYDEVTKQIAQSDLIVLNKTDKVSDEKRQKVEDKIVSINPLAQVCSAVFGQVKDAAILYRKTFRAAQIEASLFDFSQLHQLRPVRPSHQIQTVSLTIPGRFDMEKVALWLDDFLFQKGDAILRIKALLCVDGIKHKMLLQSVGNSYHLTQGSLWEAEEVFESQLVFIGSDLDKEEIENALSARLIPA